MKRNKLLEDSSSEMHILTEAIKKLTEATLEK